MIASSEHFNQPVVTIARKDVATLRQDWTVREALDAIRQRGLGEKIVYFYATDPSERLVGVVPTRRLLTASLERKVSEIMIERVVIIPHTATVLEACEAFVLHKFLAFPVVDADRRILGVVDVGFFADEVLLGEARESFDEVFDAM